MAAPEILGIYGGTFSPPHLGHKKAAETFLSAVKPDKLLVIPTFLPPHKKISPSDAPEHRLEMCRLCFGDLPRTEVSDLEIKRTGKSYTFDTVTALSKENREIFFLCGTDMLLTLDEWYRAPELFALCTFVLERREQNKELDRSVSEKITLYREKYDARIVEIDIEPIEISSTDVRNAERDHAPFEFLASMVPEAVAQYIRANKLYRD